ncbi:MAG: 30S ribosomal protein S9 [Bacteroidetes bacterium]|jgi:small subunit ribosomal protein S9|nr:MAG: 30S ribosomal protein S9 [Bacteroidota bacterium]
MEIINTTGKRKTSVARIYVKKGTGKIIINNNKDYKEYFPTPTLQYYVTQPFKVTQFDNSKYDIYANIQGGGVSGQAQALRLAISKALVEINSELRPALKKEGLLTRDPRMVERKKYGRKKARKRFQFTKR